MNDFAEAFVPMVAILGVFGIPGVIVLWYLYSRHRERMRLIEKGLTPEEVKSYFTEAKKPKSPYAALKWGILFFFVGLGIVIANILYNVYEFDEGIGFGIVFVFGGAGLIVYYAIIASKSKKDEKKPVATSTSQTFSN
jgi:hypothetical protein